MRTSKLIIAAAVALSCSLNAFGQKEKDSAKDKEAKEAGAPKGRGGLELSEDQKKKMKEIHTRTHKDVQPLKNQVNEKRARLKTLTTADKADMNEINKTIDEISALKNQIAKKKIAARMEARALLNDEQRMKFDQHKEKHRKHLKKEHGGGKGKPHEAPHGEH